jgi:hypothetical protein
MTSTCTKQPNGKYQIVVEGKLIRANSARAFPFAYDFNGIIRLSNDGQLRRLYGDPRVIELIGCDDKFCEHNA